MNQMLEKNPIDENSKDTNPLKWTGLMNNYKHSVEEIVYKQIIANPTMSSRQIPSKFRIRESLPLSKNSKVSFNELINEGLKGNEISVDVMETNLSVGNIEIYPPNYNNQKMLNLKR